MEKIIFYRTSGVCDVRTDHIFQNKEYLDNILNKAITFSKEFSWNIANNYGVSIEEYNKYVLPNNIITCYYIEYYSDANQKIVSYLQSLNICVYIPDNVNMIHNSFNLLDQNTYRPCLFNLCVGEFNFTEDVYDVIIGVKDNSGILHEDYKQWLYSHNPNNRWLTGIFYDRSIFPLIFIEPDINHKY